MKPPVIVIVGETGSGKTALAIALAKKFNGEIIAADSRTVYMGMDIGTAKPTMAERAGIPHFGFDVVEPGQAFNAYDFKTLAETAITAIVGRAKLPIVVGGTGLYIDALIYNFKFRPKPADAVRYSLEGLSAEALKERLLAANLPLPENTDNPRHLTRLLESGEPPKQPRKLRPNTLVLGVSLPQTILKDRIAQRVEAMVQAGLLDEVRALVAKYGDAEALKAPGYTAMARHLKGELSLMAAKEQIVRDDLRLAKRQRTWFKRSKDIHWLTSDDKMAEATGLAEHFLMQHSSSS